MAGNAGVFVPECAVRTVAGLVVVGEDLERVRLSVRLVLRSPRVISSAGVQSPPLARYAPAAVAETLGSILTACIWSGARSPWSRQLTVRRECSP